MNTIVNNILDKTTYYTEGRVVNCAPSPEKFEKYDPPPPSI
jgi:hypothetical protein